MAVRNTYLVPYGRLVRIAANTAALVLYPYTTGTGSRRVQQVAMRGSGCNVLLYRYAYVHGEV